MTLTAAGATVASSAIQSGSGMFGSLISGFFNKKRQREAQKFAKEQADLAYERDLDMWNKTNQYNSPLAQRNRLEKAGISPWSMYGQMSTGEADSVKSPIADTIKPNYITENVDLGLGNAMQTYFAIKQFRMQEAMVAKQLEGEQLKNNYQLLQNGMAEFNLKKIEDRYNEEVTQWKRNAEQHGWKGGEYNIAVQDADRRKDEYLYKIEEFKRQAERFNHESSLWKYDATARQLDIDQRRQNLTKGLYEIAEYPYKYQEYGDKHKLSSKEAELKDLELFFEEHRKKVLTEVGIDNKLDFVAMRSVGNAIDKLQRNLRGMNRSFKTHFSKPTFKL